MDGERFDTLARTLTVSGSRRRALTPLLGGMLVLVLGLPDTTAKKGKGKKRKGKKRKKKGATPAGSCPAGTTACGGACVDTETDPDHCGGCGRPCAVQPPATCGTTGQCIGSTCERYGQEPLNPTFCKSRECADARVSLGSSFCDGRGNCVLFTPGNQDCKPGRCDSATGGCTVNCALDSDCDEQGWCDGSICKGRLDPGASCARGRQCDTGICVAGTCCTFSCAAPNTTATCPSGTCRWTCDPGWGDCDDDFLPNGCEADLRSHSSHCGGCNQPCFGPCGPGNNGTRECVGGTCFCTL